MISVIVPVYNGEKYIRQCLDSLSKQTYKDFEVMIIDDGSTDSSGFVCDEYALKYNNFKVIHQQNAGWAEARNVGIRTSGGGICVLSTQTTW